MHTIRQGIMKKYIIGLDTGGTYTDAVLIIDYIIHRYWGKSLTSFIASRDSHPVLGVDFSLKIPLIGIGVAARHFLPGGAKRLATTVSFPAHCEVGNAIGTPVPCSDPTLPSK